MTLFDAFILGLVQGLTEFLPVSSSGHLALLHRLGSAPGGDSVALDVLLHLGTLVSVVVAFRAAIWRALTRDRAVILRLIVATAPLGLLVLPIDEERRVKDLFEAAGSNLWIVGSGFLATAGLLIWMTWLQRRRTDVGASEGESVSETELGTMTPLDAFIAGLFQVCAVLPGISRSGSTITAGLVRGAPTPEACEFAFLMSIPAVLGAVAVKGKAILALGETDPAPLAVGFVTSVVTGLLAIGMVRWLLARDRFWLFVPYLLLCAGLAFALAATG